MRQVSEEHVLIELIKATRNYGGSKEWAAAHGVTPNYVSGVKHGKYPMSQKVAEALGFWVRRRYGPGKTGQGRPEFYVED